MPTSDRIYGALLGTCGVIGLCFGAVEYVVGQDVAGVAAIALGLAAMAHFELVRILRRVKALERASQQDSGVTEVSE
jgi:hypothetical protein